MSQLALSEIWVYPIKSLGGIAVEKATVTGKGLALDRRWMLIDVNGVAMTQRVYPKMALFKPHVEGGELRVSYTLDQKEISSVVFAMDQTTPVETFRARVWDDDVQVVEVDPNISEWFTGHLGVACKLVAFPEESTRFVDPDYSVNKDQVSLADAYPFLIIGQASLDDLNRRLAAPVPMNRFRPNFVFTGGQSFIEDEWTNLSVGEISFAAVKKSDRCVLTTVNQDTAERAAEPLRTLSDYRKVGNKVYFGKNLIALGTGQVRVGDPVIPS